MECPLGYGKSTIDTTTLDTQATTTVATATETVLSKERKESPIPTKEGGRWTYPSPHQFHAATKAKGHTIDAREVPVIVDIHNAVNDEAWHRISAIEAKTHPECKDLRLVRFVGRPGDRSVKAKMMEKLLGWQEPFDRHDWLVDRCGQAKVRYIVDFYDGKPVAGRPDLVPVFIDARPALDTWGSLMDRWKILW